MHFNTAKAFAVVAFIGTVVSATSSPISNEQLTRRGNDHKVNVIFINDNGHY